MQNEKKRCLLLCCCSTSPLPIDTLMLSSYSVCCRLKINAFRHKPWVVGSSCSLSWQVVGVSRDVGSRRPRCCWSVRQCQSWIGVAWSCVHDRPSWWLTIASSNWIPADGSCAHWCQGKKRCPFHKRALCMIPFQTTTILLFTLFNFIVSAIFIYTRLHLAWPLVTITTSTRTYNISSLSN